MSLIGNERAKLTASYVNGVALIIFGVGGFAPIISSVYASSTLATNGYVVGAASVGCLGLSLILHLVARRFLGALE